MLELKHAIQAKYKIAIQHQVLVVNGGECMVVERRVCSYSAGTVSADGSYVGRFLLGVLNAELSLLLSRKPTPYFCSTKR